MNTTKNRLLGPLLLLLTAERGGILVGYEGGEFVGKDTRILLV